MQRTENEIKKYKYKFRSSNDFFISNIPVLVFIQKLNQKKTRKYNSSTPINLLYRISILQKIKNILVFIRSHSRAELACNSLNKKNKKEQQQLFHMQYQDSMIPIKPKA